MDQIEAYWLGFLCADGHLAKIYNYSRNKHRRIHLELSAKDTNHVERFLSYFSPNRKPRSRTRKHKWGTFSSVSTTISSNKLKFLNCSNFDSFKVGDPILVERLTDFEFIHWLRGFIDGDGSIAFRKINRYRRETPVLTIVSTYRRILEAINLRVLDTCKITSNTIKLNNGTARGKHGGLIPCYRVAWSGTRARDILRTVYGGADIYLDRKYATFAICDTFKSMLEVSQ